jgi:hypothetical protein
VEEGVSLVSRRWGACLPDAGPEAEGHSRLASLVSSGWGVSVELEGSNPGAGAGEGGGEVLDGVVTRGSRGGLR